MLNLESMQVTKHKNLKVIEWWMRKSNTDGINIGYFTKDAFKGNYYELSSDKSIGGE